MADLNFRSLQGGLRFRSLGQRAERLYQEREMSGWEKTLDLLSRTTYVSAGFVDRILDEDTRTIAEAWNFARGEFFTPEERLTYSDVLDRHAPEWSNEHPWLNFIAGLGMDIALDPLTYVGPGLVKGAGQLTGGILRGTAKAAKAANSIRKGTYFDDVGEAVGRGLSAGLHDELADVQNASLRASIEWGETSRATKELEAAREATLKSVDRQYGKRLKNLRNRQTDELLRFDRETERMLGRAETSALQDIEQYGIADARRVRELRAQHPTLPERAVEQAGQLGRDRRLVPERAARKGPRTVKVDQMRRAAEQRRMFKTVPEHVINPKHGVGQGPGHMTEAGEILRRGPALADDAGAQMALREAESLDAVIPRKLGKPVKDPLRGRGGHPYSEDVIGYLDELKAPVLKAREAEKAKLLSKQEHTMRNLGEWRTRALNDGMDIKKSAAEIGRARASRARTKRKWLEPAEKRAAQILADEKLRKTVMDAPNLTWKEALKAEWRGLDKSLGIVSGARRLEKTLRSSDSYIGRKYDHLRELLDRNYKLPEWLVDARSLMYGKILRAVPQVQDELKAVFGTLDKASSERLGQKFYEVFWETEKVKKAQGGLKQGQALEIRMKHLADLTDDERVVAAKVYGRFEEVGHIDKMNGLVDDLLENYVPGLYENLEKNFLGMSKKLKKNLANHFTPGERKVFHSLEEITAAGLKPVRDLQTLYTARVLSHQHATAYAMFNKSLEAMYPGLKMVKNPGPDDLLRYKTSIRQDDLVKKFPGAKRVNQGPNKGAWVDKDGVLLTPSDRTISEITYIGDGLYGPESFLGANRLAQGYDTALRYFRAAATVLKPAFAFKQLMSNTAQVYLEFGHKGLRIFDPRVMIDTGMIMSRNEGAFALRTAMGERISGKQLLQEVYEHGMLTNTPMDAGLAKSWNPRNVREMKRLVGRERAIRRISQNSEVAEGVTRLFDGALKYTDLPGHVEDWFRVSTFINARRIGMNADQAAKHTQNALFDYLHGLSEFEARWARRAIPFYSYQRFALPLIAKTMTTNPGRVANLGKVTDAFFQSWNKFTDGEMLTPSEQAVLPGWLLDQPHSFREFDDRMRATFNTFNSFTPLDIITNFQDVFVKEGGKFDVDEGMGRALEKGALSQITPVIKWPLEAMLNRKFFQGSMIAYGPKNQAIDPGTKKDVGNMDPDLFFANLSGAVGAILGRNGMSTAWAMIGRFMGDEVAANHPDTVEQFLEFITGWEEGVDPETGDRTVYMSPHRIHVATSFFPFLQEVFRQSDPELTPTERTVSLFTGSQTVKLDLGEEQQRKMREATGIVRRKQNMLQKYSVQQRLHQYDAALNDLQTYYDEIGDHLNLLQAHGVRRERPAWNRARLAPGPVTFSTLGPRKDDDDDR
jgi:hypothetical protein